MFTPEEKDTFIRGILNLAVARGATYADLVRCCSSIILATAERTNVLPGDSLDKIQGACDEAFGDWVVYGPSGGVQ